jgi:hypothetical protein
MSCAEAWRQSSNYEPRVSLFEAEVSRTPRRLTALQSDLKELGLFEMR